MKLKNIFISTVAAATLASSTVSCDYLDIVPPEQPSINNTMDNYRQALGFLLGCYIGVTDPIKSGWSVGTNVGHGNPLPSYTLGDLQTTTDEWIMDDIQFNQAPIVRAAYSNTLSGTQNVDEYKCYSIWMSNIYLFLEKLDELGVPNGIIEPEIAKEWRAECKFLKAYYHFCLFRRYGPIAIIDERVPMNAPTSAFPGRMHVDYCVKWICDQLDEAAKDLPAKREPSETGRATSTICKALKSRVLLYAASPLFNGQFPYPEWRNKVETPGYGYELVSRTYDRNKWVLAKEAAQDALNYAITEGDRELYYGNDGQETQAMLDKVFVPVDGADEEFKRAVLRMRNCVRVREPDGNKEFVWSVASNVVAYGIYNQRVVRNPIPKTSMAPNGFVNAYCCMGATLSTVLRFGTKDGYQPANDPNFPPESEWYKSAGYANEGQVLRSHIINLNKNREPRFYAWLAFDGGDYGTLLRYGIEPVPVNMLSSNAQGYNPVISQRDYCPTGYPMQKWIDTRATITNTAGSNWIFTPLPLIRLAELYLNLAECCAELGETKEALENMNVIRRRAGATELTEAMVTQSGKSLVEWVRDERSIEFFDEMHRYFDIRRWMKGDLLGFGTRMGLNAHIQNPSFETFNKPVAVNQGHVYAWGDRMYLYPIDSHELYSNPQFVQSPGY